ncbi:uncharacterized protein V1518DRAFT_421872 [Limtongia smithiae]|uniref:uncharacterized protein n=1 Tax=Limtongia smithiae TaxID=1125753 RepID=UPI0034CF9A75
MQNAEVPPGLAAAAPENTTSGLHKEYLPLETSDPTVFLLGRLESWRHLTQLLEDYVAAQHALYHETAHNYDKITRTIQDVPHFNAVHTAEDAAAEAASSDAAPAHGGISGGFFALREQSEATLNAAVECEKSIKLSVIPQVERLSHDVKEHIKGLRSNGLKDSKEVEKCRAATQKAIEALAQSTSSFGNFAVKPEAAKDPYVLWRTAMHDLDAQLLKENIQWDSLLTIQKDFKTFESHIVQGIQQTFSLLSQFQITFWDAQRDASGAITNAFTAIPEDFEWSAFVESSKGILADPAAPKRTIDRITFPNKDHEATVALIEGVVQRKGTMTLSKTYNSAYYVVTPGKFLHQFASKDYVQNPDPELSLYLPDCNLGAAYSAESGKNKFKITGKDVLSTIGRKHTYEFKTATYEDLQKWWGVINEVVTSGNKVLSPRGTMSSTSSEVPAAAAAAVAPTAAPVAAAPVQAAPVETAVVDTVPVAVAPVETVPVEVVAPVEAAPAEVAATEHITLAEPKVGAFAAETDAVV